MNNKKNFEKIYNETLNNEFIKENLKKLPENEQKIILEALKHYSTILAEKFIPSVSNILNKYDESIAIDKSKKIIKDE